MKPPQKPLNTIAVIVGGFLIALICADLFVQVRGTTFGHGVSSNVEAESTIPIFFIGLIVGVLSGIAMFFVFIVVRGRKQAVEDRELELLLDEVSRDDTSFDEAEWFSSNDTPEVREDNTHPLDPWERAADWWKSED